MDKIIEAPFIDFKSFLGVLKNGQKVFDRKPKECYEHIHIKRSTLTAALTLIEPNGSEDIIEQTIEFPNPVGKTGVIKTKEGDTIFWAKRAGKDGYSRFVDFRTPENTNKVTVILIRKKEKVAEWVVVAAFYGEKAGPEPFSPDSDKESLEFWSNHAMVPAAYEYDPTTVTYEDPGGLNADIRKRKSSIL